MKARLILLLALLVLSGVARTAAQNADEKWTRLESADKEFSFALPANFIADAKERRTGHKFAAYAFQNGVEMKFEIIRNEDYINSLKNIKSANPNRVNVFSVGDYKVRIAVLLNSASNVYSSFSIMKKDTMYLLTVISKTAEEKARTRFLNSIRLGGKPLVVQKEKEDYREETASISSIKTSTEVEEAFSRKLENNPININYEISSDEPENIDPPDLTRRLIVLEQPTPKTANLTGGSNFTVSQYYARFNVTFLANGQIGDITVLSAVDKDIAKVFIEAARKIRFVPAQVNGKNADCRQIISYSVTRLNY